MRADTRVRGRRRRTLRLSVLDGVLHAAMVGVSESFLGALAVELGHTGAALALLTTFPLVVGALAQLASPLLARRLGSPERLVVLSAFGQALSHLGLLAVTVSGTGALMPLLLAKIAFWLTGSLVGPAWGAWITDLTRGIDRSTFLARRTGIVHLGLLIAFVLAGWFIKTGGEAVLPRLAILHGVALVFRLGSAAALAGKEPMRRRRLEIAGPGEQSSRYGVPLFMAGVWFSVSITSPFFTPYMLEDLALDYAGFTVLMAAAILARALVAPWLGRVAARIGLKALMVTGAFFIAITPLIWAWWSSFAVLFAAQLFSGLAWAMYELASFQLLVASAGDTARLRFLAVAACLSTGAGVVGGLLGAWALKAFELSYQELFGYNTLVRIVPLALFVGYAFTRLPLVRGVVRGLVFRLETVRPGAGVGARVVFPPPRRRPRR
jgi:MFS family permease